MAKTLGRHLFKSGIFHLHPFAFNPLKYVFKRMSWEIFKGIDVEISQKKKSEASTKRFSQTIPKETVTGIPENALLKKKSRRNFGQIITMGIYEGIRKRIAEEIFPKDSSKILPKEFRMAKKLPTELTKKSKKKCWKNYKGIGNEPLQK